MRAIVVLLALLATLSLGLSQGYAPQDPKQDKLKLAALEKSYATAKRAYQKRTFHAPTRKAYVDATVKLGTASMMSSSLDRKVKYKQALHYYREALKLDPSNREAKQNYDMIVSIYKQMGRPIPKD